MRNATLLIVAQILVTIAVGVDRVSLAQVSEVEWSGTTGVRAWQDNGNWIGGVFPNDPAKIANFSVALPANLTVQIGATDVSIAGLLLGGTSAPVTTSVTSSTGRLLLGGTASTIESTGLAGSTNEISAPIRMLEQQLAISGPIPLAINGPIEGEGLLQVGNVGSAPLALGKVHLAVANPFAGTFRAGRGNLVLGHDDALGKVLDDNGTPGIPGDDVVIYATYLQADATNQFGYNLLADEDRTIANDIVFSEWQTIAGEHSIALAGDLTQIQNRGIINLLPASETVTISGDINIWKDNESFQRRFVVDGIGKTRITGNIRDDVLGTTGQDRRLQKTGTGVLLIDTAAGGNNHSGPDVVLMGNWHYANNGSLNASIFTSPAYSASIISLGGAVGVDVHPAGQNISSNATFIGKIDPSSTGGLMMAPSDANVNINFSSSALNNVENMSLAAPEAGLSYTGTITPNNNQYRLGGGAGTLTLPNDQLTGAARSLSVRNGGTVRLLGNNSYGGPTIIESKYVASNQELAAAEAGAGEEAQGISASRLVRSVLEISLLANGGSSSSIGAASSAAVNLQIQGSTLRYVGGGSSTDRLFTIMTAGAVLEASGTGPVEFSNSGAIVTSDAADITGTLDDFGGDSRTIYNVSSSRDVVVGMSINDPDPANPLTDFTQAPCEASGANCIPLVDPSSPGRPVTVTSVSDDGKQIGISADYPFVYKEGTRLVLGAVDRTLTLSGTSTQANILRPVIGNSAKGSRVNIVKSGAGMWLLEGANTTTGDTTVEQGTLGGNGAVGGSLFVRDGATFAPGGAGATAVGDFHIGGDFELAAGATLALEVSGIDVSNVDRIQIAGSTTLGGRLSLSTLLFSPDIGNQFEVLTAAGGVMGEFDTLELPSLDAGLGWSVLYNATNVTLEVVQSLPGDYNQNGIVDTADYTIWRNRFGESNALPNDDTPGVGPDDYTRWKQHFGQSLGSGAVAIDDGKFPAVPEPSSALIFSGSVIGLVVLFKKKRAGQVILN